MSLTRNAPSPSPPPGLGKLLSGEGVWGGGLEAGSPLWEGEGGPTGFLSGLVSNSLPLPPSGLSAAPSPLILSEQPPLAGMGAAGVGAGGAYGRVGCSAGSMVLRTTS